MANKLETIEQYSNKDERKDSNKKDRYKKGKPNFDYLEADYRWVLRQKNLDIQGCLLKSDKSQVFKGFHISKNYDLIYKVVLIHKKHLQEYLNILADAQKYYICLNKISHQEQGIIGYTSRKNLGHISQTNDEKLHLKFCRPYFSGRNFHQSIYIHNQLPYLEEQFHLFMKQALDLFHADEGNNFIMPTLDNMYFDSARLMMNCTSFQTLMFLKHKSSHLPIQNFKQLYILLSSNVETFISWQKMAEYLRETIKVKAFLIAIFCFITIRSPIQMIINESIREQQLEWKNIVVQNSAEDSPKQGNQNFVKKPSAFDTQKGGTSGRQHAYIKKNQSAKLIEDLPNRWKQLLNRYQNQACMKIFSKKIFSDENYFLKQTERRRTKHDTPKSAQDKQSYLERLFYRVFVNEQKFGWKQLFQQYPLICFINWESKSNEEKQRQKQLYETEVEDEALKIDNLQLSAKRKMKQKSIVAKEAFLYLHMAFVCKQIKVWISQGKFKDQASAKKWASNYASHLHFQTYLPLKLGLYLEQTLQFEEWFQIFFVQNDKHASNLYIKADELNKLIETQCMDILKSVPGMKLYHLKRIRYILEQKLKLNEIKKDKEQSILEKQIQAFVSKNRPFEHIFNDLIKAILQSQYGGPNSYLNHEYVKKTLTEIYPVNHYPDLNFLMIQFIKMLLDMTVQSQAQAVKSQKKKIFQVVNQKKSPISQNIHQILNRIAGKVPTNDLSQSQTGK